MSFTARHSLDIASLHQGYRSRAFTPHDVVDEVRRRVAHHPDKSVWIDLFPDACLYAQLDRLGSPDFARRPLYGVPFAVKDNIDVATRPTTAGCPAFAYTASESATVVVRLQEAGAILIGKTNLDQFATGLVGTRSPYGAPRNPFNPSYIAGGSSSGSAVAVSAGLVSFALGTDTAGSGRVPAAFNNIVGLKPSLGRISARGVVPACRSLDCVSVFSLTCSDASAVLAAASGHDPEDPFSRRPCDIPFAAPLPADQIRVAVPRDKNLEFFGNTESAALFAGALQRLRSLGATIEEVDFSPFVAAARLLYEGPWVAERLAAISAFINEQPDAMLPLTRTIIEGARRFDAVSAYAALYELQRLRQLTFAVWQQFDVLMTPTAGTIYTHEQVAQSPLQLNTNLGYYTNFMNLLDLCGIAVPGSFYSNRLPFGVTLAAPAGHELQLLALADQFHRASNLAMGATGHPISSTPPLPPCIPQDHVQLAVVGAHLRGQPLHYQLTSRRAMPVGPAATAPDYRLFALAKTSPPKPGLVRIEAGAGHQIAVEVYALSPQAFGSFVAEVPRPMVIGTVQLSDGRYVKGFLCEPYALEGSIDISRYGGWLGYLTSSPQAAALE